MFAKVLISLAAICALFAASDASPLSEDQSDCPKICPLLYMPTCATDGTDYREFVNECLVKDHNCRLTNTLAKPYKVVALNWCHTEKLDSLNDLMAKYDNLDTTKAECWMCPKIYKPVCISDGQYRVLVSNDCIMEAINCSLDDKVFKVFRNDYC